MKLKFLVMPVAVLSSVIIVVWYIYPSWFNENAENSIVALRTKIIQEQKEVSNIQIRKENIAVMNQSLQERTDVVNVVNGYYPQIREEEHIINKINHIASVTEVFLVNMTVKYASGAEDFSKLLVLPKQVKDQELDIANDSDKSQLGAIIVNVDARGQYEQLSAFLKAINLIGSLNAVKGFDMHRVDIQKDEGEELTAEEMKKLGMSGEIAFGFLKEDRRNALELIDNHLFDSSDLKFDFIVDNKETLMAKYPNSSVGKTGTLNPFLP